MTNRAFNSILFPVDFSATGEVTALHVRGLSEQTGAHVTLLHVIPWLSAWYSNTELRAEIYGDQMLRALEGQATLELEIFREKFFSGVSSQRVIRSGAVAETIVDTAADYGIDVIMMPTRGVGSSRRFLIGATTAKVLHDARCAVWTSPHLADIPPFQGYKHILCTVDRSDVPKGYLEEAARLANWFGSKLSFITAVPSYSEGFGEERQIASISREFPQAEVHEMGPPPQCTALLKTGSVGDVVRHAVETHDADLVITNRGHLKHPFGRFRTHAYEIVLESPCPVLSLCISSRVESEDGATSRSAAATNMQPA